MLLELGGKAPLIVLDDADIDAAVNATAFGAFMNQGQICMSTERVVIDEKIADPFVQKLSAKAASLPVRDPSLGPTVLGSMVNPESAARVASLIEDAAAKGATIAAGGKCDGTLIEATVLDGVTPAMKIYSEESFGPVVTVVRVNGDEESPPHRKQHRLWPVRGRLQQGHRPCLESRPSSRKRNLPHQRSHSSR